MRLFAVLIATGLLAAAPATAAVPSGNLLANPGGEAVPGSRDDAQIVAPPSWKVSSAFTEVAYGASGFPTTDDAVRLGGGANLFAGGPNSAESAATQVANVSGAAAEIDGGTVVATLSALIGGYASQNDSATITAAFLDAGGAAKGALAIGPVTAAERNQTTDLLPRSRTAAVPAGTRSISVRIDAVRSDGAYNDSYVDNVSLTVGSTTPVFK